MTDRLTPSPPAAPIMLSSRGKLWGVLRDDGRLLEVARRGITVCFDLVESARTGRAVIVEIEEAEE